MSTRKPLPPGYQYTLDLRPPLPALPQLWTADDVYNFCDETTIRSFGEDPRVERKLPTISQTLLSEYVSMWANTQPHGGVTFIGVSNKGNLDGCKGTAEQHLNDLRAVRALCPDAKVEFKRVPVRNARGDDDFIEVMRVYYREDKLVETGSGEAFMREGDRKRRLSEDEKREIKLNKGQLDIESERVSLVYPTDFDGALLKQYRDQFVAKRQLSDRFTIEDVLVLSKLGKWVAGRFSPFLSCALLFAKDPREVAPGAYIRVLRYDGTEEEFGLRLNSVADKRIEGPLPLQISAAADFIDSQMRNFTRLGRDGRFETSPEYPKEVWLEAVVNAVVHRSYNLKNMNIFVKMFEDKFLVESPGSFLPPTTAETVFEAHNPRNPNTMWALYYFDFVQCAFEGTRRMRDTMRQANLPDPIFSQRQAGTFQVSVTLKNNAEHRKVYVRSEAAAGINPHQYEALGQSEKMIVNYLTDNARVNVTDAARVMALDWRGSKDVLENLERKGVLKRSPGRDRSRHRFYYLPKK
ncbi:ATP-binding protein [Reyranella sp.]|uniref:ATP-binding protein n=1 Tax=Reyranella sp. TaxID=1929291 RepID=UPI003D0BC082